MHIRYYPARLAAVAAVAAAFAGCSDAQRPVSLTPSASVSGAVRSNFGAGISAPDPLPQAERRAHSAYDSKRALLFIANFGVNDAVEVYDPKANKTIATITDSVQNPTDVCLDKQRTLYVVNEDLPLTEYKAGQTAPFQEITQGLNLAAFCAIDSGGNLWVTNVASPNVTEYPKGSTSPSTIITDGITYPEGIAFNAKGDMYVANLIESGGGSNVQVYRRGASSPTMTITNGVTEPCGIVVDAKGTLYVTNLRFNTVTEYLAGKKSPYQTITDGVDLPDGATVNAKGELFVASFASESHHVTEYAPGSTKPLSFIEDGNNPEGMVYSPPILPKK